MAVKREYNVAALTKAVRIVEYIKEKEGATLLEIYEELSLPKSSTYQIIQALIGYGILRQEVDKKYRLGFKLFEYGQASVAGIDLRQIARPFLEELAERTGHTVHLGILNDQYDGIFLDRVNGKTYTFTHTRVGARIMLECSATGKALVAWQEEPLREQIIQRLNFEKATQPNAIKTAEAYRKDCDLSIKRGYAVDREESCPNICGLGMPLFRHDGKVGGAIAVGGLIQMLDPDNCEKEITLLKKTAGEISKHLGN